MVYGDLSRDLDEIRESIEEPSPQESLGGHPTKHHQAESLRTKMGKAVGRTEVTTPIRSSGPEDI